MPAEFRRAVEARIEREILERAAWVSLAAALAALLTAYSLADVVAPVWLAAWTAVQLVQAVTRAWIARLVLARLSLAEPRVLRLVIGSALFAGGLWGALPWLPQVEPDPVAAFYTAAIVAGVVAGTSISYASAPQMMLAIAFPAILPTVAMLALRGDAPGFGAALLMLLLGALVFRESRRNREHVERDIAQYLMLERESRRLMGRETLLRLGADALPEYIAYIDREHRYVFVNRRYVELLGMTRDRIIGRPMREVVGDWYGYLRPRLEAALAGEPQDFEVKPPSRVPRESHYRVRYIPDRRDDGGVRGVFAVTIDVTAYRRSLDDLARRAEHDPELGVLTAASLRERLAREHEMVKQAGGSHALCLVEIDSLDAIDARHGPAVRTAALQRVADVLGHAVRDVDLAGRVGSAQLAVLFADCAVETAVGRCHALIEAIDGRPLRVGEGEMPLRVSIGVTALRPVDLDPEAALARLEAAVYAARHAGGNRVEVA